MEPLNSRETLSETISCVLGDARRYKSRFFFSAGFWVSFSYRLRRLRKYGGPILFILLPVDVLFGIVKRFLSDTTIPACVSVGSGLYLPHPNGIVINHMARIGKDVALFQQVTIGEWHGRAPVVGDGTAIYSGAKVFGEVTIGRSCRIGANVVVTSDVPNFMSLSLPAPDMRTRAHVTSGDQLY